VSQRYQAGQDAMVTAAAIAVKYLCKMHKSHVTLDPSSSTTKTQMRRAAQKNEIARMLSQHVTKSVNFIGLWSPDMHTSIYGMFQRAKCLHTS